MTNGSDNPNVHSVRQADEERETVRRELIEVERDRRDGLRRWQEHVDRRLDEQDEKLREMNEKLDEILTAFKGSKLSAAAITWLAGVGAAIAVIWHNMNAK